jgi:hypothetical protein
MSDFKIRRLMLSYDESPTQTVFQGGNMVSKGTILIIALFVLISFIQISCKGENGNDASGVSKSSSAEEAAYKDPFAYCAAVGTVDSPDSRYVGPKMPEAIVVGLKKAFGVTEGAPPDVFERGTYWRCMDGKVYACNVGANLPCTEKADTSREPNQGMKEWCDSNQDSEFVPAFAAGRATVYEWRCTGNEPTIVKEINKPDSAGYISNIWYEISPMP